MLFTVAVCPKNMHIYLQKLKMSANHGWRKTVKTKINKSVLSDLEKSYLPLGDDTGVVGAVVLVAYIKVVLSGWPINE